MKTYGKIVDLIIAFFAIEIIPRFSTIATNLLNPIIENLDKDGVFLWIAVHHVFQLLLTIVAMKLYFKSSLRDWGFNLDNRNKAFKTVIWFFLIYLSIQLIGTVIMDLIRGNSMPSFSYPLTLKNILGYYSFEAFLSGTCEEPLFRGFVIIVLAQSWKGRLKIGKIDFSVAGILSAIIFTYAHISFNLFPFEIIHISPLQLLTAFGLGLLYAKVFENTKSLLIPIILHNVSNIIAISIPFIKYVIFQ